MRTERRFKFGVAPTPMVVGRWEFWTQWGYKCLEFRANFIFRFSPQKGSIMVSSIEGKVLAVMILVEVKLNPFPCLIEFILILLNVEEVEMVIKPSSMLTHVAEFVPRLLELIHVESSLSPLAARQQEFLPKTHWEFLNVEDMDPFRFTRQQIWFDCW